MTVDAGTVLATITLGISAWTLRTVILLSNREAAAKAHGKEQAKRLDTCGERITKVEERMGLSEINIAKLQQRRA